MNVGAIRAFLERDWETAAVAASAGASGYALPEASLALLAECVARLAIRRVFEFGTGKSTELFLRLGCMVTAVEDGADWLAETLTRIDETKRTALRTHLLPLQCAWLGAAPLRGWMLPPAALAALEAAELVLIDSPALPPFREHALATALARARQALIIVDDAAIPTVARFCRRLAEQNGAPFRELALDHGLFLCGPATRFPFHGRRPLVETLKAWRRYFHPRAGA